MGLLVLDDPHAGTPSLRWNDNALRVWMTRKRVPPAFAGMTNKKKQWTIERCKKYGFNYTDRLHILIWGNKREFDYLFQILFQPLIVMILAEVPFARIANDEDYHSAFIKVFCNIECNLCECTR